MKPHGRSSRKKAISSGVSAVPDAPRMIAFDSLMSGIIAASRALRTGRKRGARNEGLETTKPPRWPRGGFVSFVSGSARDEAASAGRLVAGAELDRLVAARGGNADPVIGAPALDVGAHDVDAAPLKHAVVAAGEILIGGLGALGG